MPTYILTRNTLYNVVTSSDSKQNKHGFARGKNCNEGHKHINQLKQFLFPNCSFPPHPLCQYKHLWVCAVPWTMTRMSSKTRRFIFPGTTYPRDQRLKCSILIKNLNSILQGATNKCLVLLTLLHIIEVSKCLAHSL